MKTPTVPIFPEHPRYPLWDNSRKGRFARNDQVKLEKVYRFCRKRRRGITAIEFASVAPVFFILIFGIIEFGRMIMVQQIITNASRAGARVGALDAAASGDIEATVESYSSSARPNGANITVDPADPNTAGYGEPVTVTVSVPFDQVSWLPSPMFIGGDTRLSASTVMRREPVQ